MSDPHHIRYCFDLPDGTQKSLEFTFDPTDFRLANPPPSARPFWTELEFNRCANCPLSAAEHSHCPAALQMTGALEPLSAMVSFDTLGVTVTQAGRTVRAETTAQQAMSSVLGLIMATAGCPWTDRFRPMARFHLPFASDIETVYRSVCMFLLAHELTGAGDADGFAQVEKLYENLHVVNRDMSRRLGAATRADPARNAIALLDAYGTLLPAALECSLEELKPLFGAWRGGGLPAI
ncbi:MAG TPA: hypothetical protein VHZ53_18700 [Steroidobacteraceae bacterium]|jgi:hypothetical protein|nr:hypothetical protein [Steroidobacteraceae bacterium]